MSYAESLVGIVDEGKLPDVVTAIEASVLLSFTQDKSRATGSEVKRRIEICIALVKTLRGDLKWAVARIVDYLPTYLRCELDGISYSPSTSSVWSPDRMPILV